MPNDTYMALAVAHLVTVVPAALIGLWQFVRPKGTPIHRGSGYAYMLLMLLTAVLTLFMPAVVGPTLLGHFGFIHVFAVVVLTTVPLSWWAVRNGNIDAHKRSMRGMYIGAVLIAGFFAFMPGRLLNTWLFG